MAFLKFSPFSLLFLAIFALLLGQIAEAKHKTQSGINPTCKNVSDERLCNIIVMGATNVHDASINAIEAAIRVSKNIRAMTPLVAKAAEQLEPRARNELLKLCTEDFKDAIDELETSIRYINQGDMGGADSYLSGAIARTSDCKDAITGAGGTVLPLYKMMAQFNKVMSSTLAVVHQIEM